ncbi:MAG: GNAT family N-acetyltransferase [Lacinutrix venerupis]
MKLINSKNLESKRLILRSTNMDDVELVYALRSNAIVRKYIMQPLYKTQEEAVIHIKNLLIYLKENKSISWTIINKKTNQKLGSICLWNLSEDRKTAEVGYDLLPEYFNKGYMSEALQEVISFGFNKLRLKAIEAFTHTENKASKKLLLANGFTQDSKRKDLDFPKNIIFTLKK